MIRNKNFSGQTTPSQVDVEYRNCNFSQPAPTDGVGGKEGIRIFPSDDTPRTFIECNLVNATPPPGSSLTSCNTTIRESAIIASSDKVTIDGQDITVNNYVDRIHGRTNPSTLEPDYKPSPIDIEIDNES